MAPLHYEHMVGLMGQVLQCCHDVGGVTLHIIRHCTFSGTLWQKGGGANDALLSEC